MPSESPTDVSAPPSDDPPDATDRYAALPLEDGAVVIYDRENHRAWIQSDAAVELSGTA